MDRNSLSLIWQEKMFIGFKNVFVYFAHIGKRTRSSRTLVGLYFSVNKYYQLNKAASIKTQRKKTNISLNEIGALNGANRMIRKAFFS